MLRTAVTSKRSQARRWVVGLCFAAILFDGYDLIVYGSVVPALLNHQEWALSPQQVGAIGSYALMGMFVGAMAAGTLTDLIGRRKTLIGCLAWFSAAMVAVAAAPNPELLGLFRFIAGLGFGGVVPTAIALTIEYAPEGRRNLYNALALCGFPVGGILAAVAAMALLADTGFRTLFLLGGLPLLTIVPLAVWKLPESPSFTAQRTRPVPDAGPSRMRLVDVFQGRNGIALALFALANFCGFLLVYGLNTWLPQLMKTAGFELGSALAFLLVLNAGAIAGGIWGSALADRIGSRIVTGAAFGVATACIFLLGTGLPTAALYVLVGVAGAATIGTQIVLFGYVATHFPPTNRATAVGFSSGIGRLGAVTGPLLGGFLIASNLSLAWNFATFAAVALAGAVFAVAVPARSRNLAQTVPDTP